MADLPEKEEVELSGMDKLQAFLEEHGDKFKAFSVLNIQPGDTIVLSHPQVMGNGAIGYIMGAVTEILGQDIKCIILEEGMEVKGVLRRNEEVGLLPKCKHQEARPGTCNIECKNPDNKRFGGPCEKECENPIDIRHSDSKCSNCGHSSCPQQENTPECRACYKWIP